MKSLRGILVLGLAFVLGNSSASAQTAADQPDLAKLSQAGYFMGPGNRQYPVDQSWVGTAAIMKDLDMYDHLVKRIQKTVCGSDQNKSVLLIGEPSQAYRYLWARIATVAVERGCADMWHFEVNVSKVEAGHKYVGEVEEYWQNNILVPSDKKKVVMYIPRLSGLMGIGSHSNDEDGIEREYAANISSGRMRSISFMDKFEYNQYSNSRYSYVIESFADKIVLPPMEFADVDKLVSAYLRVLYPNLTLGRKEADALYRLTAFYNPNRGEPDRTLANLDAMIRAIASNEGSEVVSTPSIQTANPYGMGEKLEFTIDEPGALSTTIEFEYFATEPNFDKLEVIDPATNTVLESLSGMMGAMKRTYPKSKLLLRFTSDSRDARQGFKVARVVFAMGGAPYTFTLEDVRQAVMSTAQVPRWMIDRDYTILRNLEANLEKDVVGVGDAKSDISRLAKIGYIAGKTEDKPMGSIMLAGPTGTGKSFIAKNMAQHMQLRLITLDMTAYKDPQNTLTFTRTLARHLANNPYAIFLFEEIDKAAIEVLDQLYFMLDEGIFYDEFQRPLFARGAFIIMTTNAGEKVILENPDAPDLKSKVMVEMQRVFRASFLNRFEAISIFKPFTDAEFVRLANIMSTKKAAKLKEMFGWELSWDQGTIDYVSVNGKSRLFGARPMERLIENVFGVGIAEYNLMKRPIEHGEKVHVTKVEGENKFAIKVGDEPPVPFIVDPDMNEGDKSRRKTRMMNMKFWKAMTADRMYED